jgi:hypothetical protein
LRDAALAFLFWLRLRLGGLQLQKSLRAFLLGRRQTD